MSEDIYILVNAMLLMHTLSTALLLGFWSRNRSTVGLSMIGLSVVVSGIGLVLAFVFGIAEGFLHVTGIFAFLILGHATAWLGLVDFWHKKTRKLTAAVGVLGSATLVSIMFYYLGGGTPAGRTAILSMFFAVSSFAIVGTIYRAKGFRIDIYESAFKESRVGSYFVMGLFFFHGLFNVCRVFSWPELGLDTLFSDADAYVDTLTVLEALMFTPIFVIGVIMMVAERLQTELRIEQMLEPVTRSLNRRAFVTVSKVVLARARRNADAVSILMVDVSNFKEIRDIAGRSGCDKILRQVATAIVAGRREQDIFSRFSNDEFLLILPGTPEEGADLVLERVEAEIVGRSYDQKGKAISVKARLQHYTARGEDLEAEGMIDAVAKKLAA